MLSQRSENGPITMEDHRKKLLLLGFAVLVLAPVILVWTFAWPILQPVSFPVIAQGQMLQPSKRDLTSGEVEKLNQWLQKYRSAWGTKGEKSPGHPSAAFVLEGKEGRKLYLSFWHFRHGDDVAGFQTEENGPFRMRSADKEPLEDLMKNFPDVPWKAIK
ncbi:hypothetical protein PT277_03875 [Acetobacteraceae bacterium ESL0709]|nr:hypothetical protein [Acetobacteraceae bacterium ESL0697]MDF7677839.1 hypothetical protein [Acetobacteraceae bacterium ESL0709]